MDSHDHPRAGDQSQGEEAIRLGDPGGSFTISLARGP
jgi:hypothetical protein